LIASKFNCHKKYVDCLIEGAVHPRKHFSSQSEWDKFFVKRDTINVGMSEKDREEFLKILPKKIKAARALQKKNDSDKIDEFR
jgi:hypothetical protein